MRIRTFLLTSASAMIAGCAASESTTVKVESMEPASGRFVIEAPADGSLLTLSDFKPAARHFGNIIEIPRFERTPEEIERSASEAMSAADERLDMLASQDHDAATFKSTIWELDDIFNHVNSTTSRLYLIKETSPDPEVRDAATEQVKRLQDWLISVQYRQDVYEACRAFDEAYKAGRRTPLEGEMKRLYEFTMRDYRRAGLHLDPSTRAKIEDLQKQLTEATTNFGRNYSEAKEIVVLQPYELEGVPESVLDSLPQESGSYPIEVTNIAQYLAVMQNCPIEETRRRLKIARYSIAMDENIPILNEMVELRGRIADTLGYESWADYRTEILMSGDRETALNFLLDLKEGLEPKFRDELETMREMKVADTGDEDAEIKIWDFRYYMNEIKKRNYDIDTEALRVYFPLDETLDGMFDIYETIFGLRFYEIEPPQKWTPDLRLFMTTDARTGEPLGMFYLDLFPRDGKYKHFAQFDVLHAKRLDPSRYQRPVVALVCNFTPPTDDRPSLLLHDEVETLFHEFGHALHSIVTRADSGRFAMTGVPRDFVEAPSQMLENWVWEPDVVNTFAADYRDPSKKIDPEILERMKQAQLATIGTFYRRQLCFGIGDLRLHGPGTGKESDEVLNRAMAEVFLAPPEGTAFAATFGHMMGYSASYYGYAWADAIAADMATVFENAPGGLMDRDVGMKMRNEIYAVGGARDVNESIRIFLGRERSIEPFLESIGLE